MRQSMGSSSSTRAYANSKKTLHGKIINLPLSGLAQGLRRGRAERLLPVKSSCSGKVLGRKGKSFCVEV